MKHTKLFLFFLAPLVLCSCKGDKQPPKEEVHHYSDRWSYDDVDHYKECIDPGFEGKANAISVEAHHWVETKETVSEITYTCDVCNHTKTEQKTVNVFEISDVRSIHTDKQQEYATGDYRTLPEGIKGSGDNSRPNPVTITVKESAQYSKQDVSSYTLKLSNTSDLREYKEYTSTTGEFTLYNLNIHTAYYYKYIAQVGAQSYESELDAFYVEGDAPRNIYIDGTDNVRDLGGWPVEGEPTKRIPQNLIYRSANLDAITTKGRQQIAELGIKTEIDIRLPEDTKNHSTIEGVTYYNFGMNNTSAYGSDVTKESIKNAMKIFAEPANYPILFHCTAGADRTGFMSYFLNSLAGGTQESRYKDYMYTNFGNHGSRTLANISGYHSGASLETFLKEIGVTQTEIDSIKTILAPVEPTFDFHTTDGNWAKVDDTYHNFSCNDCTPSHSLVKDEHHFSAPYTKEGVNEKHFVKCKQCGFEKEMEDREYPTKVIRQISVAIDELMSNIIKYGYPEHKGPISVSMYELTGTNMLKIQFTDRAIPFDPTAIRYSGHPKSGYENS